MNSTPKFRVAFIGNFRPEFSSESYYRAALQQIGWDVIPLQEDTTSTDEIMRACLNADFLMIVHTHQWEIKWKVGWSMEDVLAQLRITGIPTVGVHLDRYWGIRDREEMIRNHWFFRCQEVWSSDGGNQDKFADAGVNHFWFPPGVCQTHCFKGNTRPEYTADVCFVGAREYHNEVYPFRKQMVDWLADTKHDWSVIRFGGDQPTVRGPQLNDIYTSAKIVVGDSIFAGAPYYWSDRIPETQGRNGFLLHPKTEGMEFPMASYAPQSIKNLNEQIEYYLVHEKEREDLRQAGFEYTRNNATWAHRMLMILNHLGLN